MTLTTTSLFHMKITASITKSLHQDSGPRYLHFPILFLIHSLLLLENKSCCHHCFPQQIKSQITVQPVLVITCLGVLFGINCQCKKMSKLLKWNEGNIKFFKNQNWDLSQKLREPDMRSLVSQTKPTNTLYWNYCLLTEGNHKSRSGQLQNNYINGTMLITIKCVIYLVSIWLKNATHCLQYTYSMLV